MGFIILNLLFFSTLSFAYQMLKERKAILLSRFSPSDRETCTQRKTKYLKYIIDDQGFELSCPLYDNAPLFARKLNYNLYLLSYQTNTWLFEQTVSKHEYLFNYNSRLSTQTYTYLDKGLLLRELYTRGDSDCVIIASKLLYNIRF